jgi:hypothetical protein
MGTPLRVVRAYWLPVQPICPESRRKTKHLKNQLQLSVRFSVQYNPILFRRGVVGTRFPWKGQFICELINPFVDNGGAGLIMGRRPGLPDPSTFCSFFSTERRQRLYTSIHLNATWLWFRLRGSLLIDIWNYLLPKQLDAKDIHFDSVRQ